MNSSVKLLIAITVLVVMFLGGVSCGQAPQLPVAPTITFLSEKQVYHQRETIRAAVQPALDRKQFLQIWVRADDNQWYPCEPAKLDPSSGAWKAVCQFGSDKHPAADGAKFLLGAFYTADRVNAEYLPDAVWSLLKNQATAPVIFGPGK
jgi:hypothetical protein